MQPSFCFIAFLISVFKLAWPQSEPMRCFDCNSGGSGFGSAICPPNGNLKQEVLTTVRCTERCFSRTIPEKTGVVQRGCSSGIGFFLSRPLPQDGCVKVADNNWWCFCAKSLCNIDDMTQYGNGKEPRLIEKEKDELNARTLGPWSREKPATQPARRTVRTTQRTERTQRTRKPEVVTDWTGKSKQYEQTTEKLHVVAPVRDYDKFEERDFSRQESVEVSMPEKEEDPVDPVDPMEPVGPSYQDPMETWDEDLNYDSSEESPEHKEDDFYRELPFDSHYTQHTHNANGREPSRNFEIPVFLP